MSNINRTYAKTRVSRRPWHWYHERLPKYLREVMANASHNWSDEQVYQMWRGIDGVPKYAPVDIIRIIEECEDEQAYNWNPELKNLMTGA